MFSIISYLLICVVLFGHDSHSPLTWREVHSLALKNIHRFERPNVFFNEFSFIIKSRFYGNFTFNDPIILDKRLTILTESLKHELNNCITNKGYKKGSGKQKDCIKRIFLMGIGDNFFDLQLFREVIKSIVIGHRSPFDFNVNKEYESIYINFLYNLDDILNTIQNYIQDNNHNKSIVPALKDATNEASLFEVFALSIPKINMLICFIDGYIRRGQMTADSSFSSGFIFEIRFVYDLLFSYKQIWLQDKYIEKIYGISCIIGTSECDVLLKEPGNTFCILELKRRNFESKDWVTENKIIEQTNKFHDEMIKKLDSCYDNGHSISSYFFIFDTTKIPDKVFKILKRKYQQSSNFYRVKIAVISYNYLRNCLNDHVNPLLQENREIEDKKGLFFMVIPSPSLRSSDRTI